MEQNINVGNVFVTIRVDADCFLVCDGEYVEPPLKANKTEKIQLSVGQHLLEFISAEYSTVRIKKQVNYTEVGKNYIELENGLNELIEKQRPVQECLTITKIDFVNTNKEGEVIDESSTELIDRTLKYLEPRITYSSKYNTERQIKFDSKIIRLDSSIDSKADLPKENISSEMVMLKKGENIQISLCRNGSDEGRFWVSGKYIYQLYVEKILLYETTFTIKEGFTLKELQDSINIKKIEFANVSQDGRVIDDYGMELIDGKLECLRVKLEYFSELPQEKNIMLSYRFFCFDNQENFGDLDIVFKPGENDDVLLSRLLLRNDNKSGNYKFQLLYENAVLYEKTFVIKSILDYITIKQIEIANVDQKGFVIDDYGTDLIDGKLQYISPKVTYSCSLQFETPLTLNTDFTSRETEDVLLEQGEDKTVYLSALCWHNRKYGEYKYRLLYKNAVLYETTFGIKSILNYLTIDQVELSISDRGYGSKLIDYEMSGEDTKRDLRVLMTYSSVVTGALKMYMKILGPTGGIEGNVFRETIQIGEKNQLLLKDDISSLKFFNVPGKYKYQLWYTNLDSCTEKNDDSINELFYEKEFLVLMDDVKDIQVSAYHGGRKGECICDYGSTIKQVRNLKNHNSSYYIDCLMVRFEYVKDYHDSGEVDVDVKLIYPNGSSLMKHQKYILNSGKHESLIYNAFINLKDNPLECGKYTIEFYQEDKKITSSDFMVEQRGLFERKIGCWTIGIIALLGLFFPMSLFVTIPYLYFANKKDKTI